MITVRLKKQKETKNNVVYGEPGIVYGGQLGRVQYIPVTLLRQHFRGEIPEEIQIVITEVTPDGDEQRIRDATIMARAQATQAKRDEMRERAEQMHADGVKARISRLLAG